MTGIAVVVPCFNLGRFVSEALSSVRRQTRPATELIVVDDGSDDPYTRHILGRLQADATCVVRTANHGVAAARNLGVRLSASPYVVLLDADDVLDATYLERLGARLDDCPHIDFVTSGIRAFGEAEYVWCPPACTWVQTFIRGGPHVSSMFRRRVWELVGGFDERLGGYEDSDFWLSAIERGMSGEVIEEALLSYRVRRQSRYREAIRESHYVSTRKAIRLKHGGSPVPVAELLLEEEAFLEEQRQLRRRLVWRDHELAAELEELRHSVATTTTAIASAGGDAIDWADVRRVSPVSSIWGLDRGKPLDRYYIEAFLYCHRRDIRGRVLEVKDPHYTRRFGQSRVVRSDVLDCNAANEQATIVADLENGTALPAGVFDCIVLTQTLHFTFDMAAVIRNLFRMLKPGGVVLCTVPCVSRLAESEDAPEGDFWRLTGAAVRRLFAEVFPDELVDVTSAGNVFTCAAFLHGLCVEEVPEEKLDDSDPECPLICLIRARKPAGGANRYAELTVSGNAPVKSALVLLYHRVASRSTDPQEPALDKAAFLEQLKYLAASYRLMQLDDLPSLLASGDLPDRALALTFDDGYLEHLTVVSPMLLELGIPATFFVNSAGLDRDHEEWWDVLERVMRSAELPATLDLAGDGTWVRATATPAERQAAHRALVELLYGAGVEPRSEVVGRLVAWAGIDAVPRETHRVMRRAEIRRLSERPGHRVGCHSTHHLNLAAQPPGVVQEELVRCKRDLESIVRNRIGGFAYPYGEFSRTAVDAVRAAGFAYGVTTESRPVRAGCRRLLLPRLEVTCVDVPVFGASVEAALAGVSGPA